MNRQVHILIAVSALALIPAFRLYAQSSPASPASTQPAKVSPAPYQLAAEDGISINVINFANLSIGNIVVPPDGKITVPLLEPISVVGITTDELARILTEKWKRYVVNPSVTVSLTSKRKESVLFFGFVARPATVEYRPTLHLMEALAEVGGALPNGDLIHLTVTRKSGDKQTLDLSKPETRGGTSADIQLQAGDVIYVPERRTQITVVGEVNKAGSFDYKDDMTVMDAITLGGGVRLETADYNNATIIHDGKESKLDLDALLRKGDLSHNIKLVAGDRIMVPEFKNRTYTFGAVAKPGYYPFKDGDRVLDALNSSGGPVRDANLAQINIIRIDKAKNTSKVTTIDIEKALKKGQLENNIALLPGDVIFIPDKKHKFGVDDVLRGIGALTGFGSIFRLLGGGY